MTRFYDLSNISGRRLRLTAPRDETELARLVRLLEVLPC